MTTKLLKDIENYIAYLNANGLWITVHGQGIDGLLEHNIHRNPYCALVKTDAAAWQRCKQHQQKVFRGCGQECFFGMCYAGMEEYVFFVNDKTFVSVSGYGIHKEKASERIHRLTQEYFLKETELLHVYENSLKHKEEDPAQLAVLVRPLCHMLQLLQLQTANAPITATKSAVFDSIRAYVQFHFMQDISIADIAQACACSQSTVSHLFRQYTGEPVKKYIAGLRMAQAKKLLETSDLPVSTVAQMCGFSNINYFPTAFKKQTGVSPTEYRAYRSTSRLVP